MAARGGLLIPKSRWSCSLPWFWNFVIKWILETYSKKQLSLCHSVKRRCYMIIIFYTFYVISSNYPCHVNKFKLVFILLRSLSFFNIKHLFIILSFLTNGKVMKNVGGWVVISRRTKFSIIHLNNVFKNLNITSHGILYTI